ncbi:hypothetical protein EV421DRAFT_1733388 [Armillaria borealis]|uniref:Uncharacterized protein n=1 Tax=Armillaria borealis TaxID=47425 RepID=A0AA39JVW0_9AGAR|nr:hypothetical protein EV421DRAFT_1733388 [Armillaria borealis]
MRSSLILARLPFCSWDLAQFLRRVPCNGSVVFTENYHVSQPVTALNDSRLSGDRTHRRSQLWLVSMSFCVQILYTVSLSAKAQDTQQTHLCHALAGVTTHAYKTHARKCKGRILRSKLPIDAFRCKVSCYFKDTG